MDFKQFYKELIFSVDDSINTLFMAKQGDTKSRGFYVTLTQNKIVIPVTNETMTFYALKPDGTRVYVDAIQDGDKFRIDLTNQVFAVPGDVNCELTLRGNNGEVISSKTFQMKVDKYLAEDSIVSEDERGVIGDVLEGYQGAITDLEDELETVKTEYLAHTKNIMPHEFQDLKNDKTYKYGFQISEEGNPQLIFEEVENV